MKKILYILPILFLVGCTSVPEIKEKPIIYQKPKLEVQKPPAINQLPVKWFLITKENLEQKIKEIEQNQGAFVIMALTPQGYENLSINVAELRTYILQQKAVIAAYELYYGGEEEKIERQKTLMQRMLQ